MSFFNRDFLSLIHSSTQFVDFWKRNDRNGQFVFEWFVDKVYITQLESFKDFPIHGLNIFFEIKFSTRDLIIRTPPQFLSWCRWIAFKCHFVNFLAVWKLNKIEVFFDSRQNEIACTINCSITTWTSIRKWNDPFDLRCIFLDHHDCLAYAIRFGISRKMFIKSHAVQFKEIISSGSLNQSQHFWFVKAWSIRQNAVQISIHETTEMQIWIVHNFSWIMVFFYESVSDIAWNHFDDYLFAFTHCSTIQNKAFQFAFSFQ